jgi:ABC-type uncharacterized transport system substrate-binding protein
VPLQELAGKRLEILKAAVPSADHIAVFIVPSPLGAKVFHDHEAAARVLGVMLHPINISDRSQLEEAFRDAVRARARALVLTQGPFFSEHQKIIVALALKHRLPMLSSETGSAEAGSLLYYGARAPSMRAPSWHGSPRGFSTEPGPPISPSSNPPSSSWWSI